LLPRHCPAAAAPRAQQGTAHAAREPTRGKHHNKAGSSDGQISILKSILTSILTSKKHFDSILTSKKQVVLAGMQGTDHNSLTK
jgi:hypothetical protein